MLTHGSVKVREVKFFAQFCPIPCLVVMRIKARVDFINRRGGMLTLVEDRDPLGVMQNEVKVVGLIGEAAIVKKYIQSLLATNLAGNLDGVGSRYAHGIQWQRVRVWRLQYALSDQAV